MQHLHNVDIMNIEPKSKWTFISYSYVFCFSFRCSLAYHECFSLRMRSVIFLRIGVTPIKRFCLLSGVRGKD